MRLHGTVADVVTEWLARNVSAVKKETILARIRVPNGGRLGDSRPRLRMTGERERATQIGQIFRALYRRLGFEGCGPMWSPPISVGGNRVSWNWAFEAVTKGISEVG